MNLDPTGCQIFETFEIRWFKTGQIPFGWKDAHRSLGYGGCFFQERTDRYLKLAHSPDLGIKLRENRLELKHLISSPQLPIGGRPIPGLPQRWRKNSWSGISTSLLPFLSTNWMDVRKRRCLVTLAPHSNGEFELLPLNDRTGLQIELTELPDINGHPWWSFAVECGTCIAYTALFFLEQVRFLMRFFPSNDLDEALFLSYPAWLDAVLGCETVKKNDGVNG